MDKTVIKRKDQVFVEKPAILEDLIDSITKPSQSINHSNLRPHHASNIESSISKISFDLNDSVYNTQNVSLTSKKSLKPSKHSNRSVTSHMSDEEYSQLIQIHLDDQKAKDLARFEEMLNRVDQSKETIKDVNRTLNAFDFAKHHKYKKQFDDWNVGVHGAIQKQITIQKISSMDSKQLHDTKCSDYNKFLDITNRKANIYRDIIIESEYDPLEPNRRALKVQLAKGTRDPTLLDQQKQEEECTMLNPGQKHPKPKLGKNTLPVELWSKEKIASTSFGFTSETSMKSASKPRTSNSIRSNIKFDHFDFPRNNQGVSQEMPRGKRIIPVGTTISLGDQ